MKYLFFDTETTGFPTDWNADPSHFEKWPHIVQIAWILSDEKGNILKNEDYLIRPENYRIPPDMIHGISHEKAMVEGVILDYALHQFGLVMEEAHCIVCHNYDFDSMVVTYDTMKPLTIDYLNSSRGLLRITHPQRL